MTKVQIPKAILTCLAITSLALGLHTFLTAARAACFFEIPTQTCGSPSFASCSNNPVCYGKHTPGPFISYCDSRDGMGECGAADCTHIYSPYAEEAAQGTCLPNGTCYMPPWAPTGVTNLCPTAVPSGTCTACAG
jgi:hypothetical protein